MCSNYISELVNFSPAGTLMYTHEPTPGFPKLPPPFLSPLRQLNPYFFFTDQLSLINNFILH